MPYPCTLLSTSFEDLFSVELDLFRNALWTPRFLFTDDENNTIDLSASTLTLVICPLNPNQTLGAAVITGTDYTLDTDGAAVFSIGNLEVLSPAGLYQWYLLHAILGQGPQIAAAGPLGVWDSPALSGALNQQKRK